ncbi:MAG: glycosyltransferase [Burkholderiales bacterium]
MKRLLMIAYHFPPFAGSSGVQRTLRFVQQLPQFGWHPTVLTVHPRGYAQTSPDLVAEIPPGVDVHRAFVVDTARHLSIGGRYAAFLARPDRWRTWWLGAVPVGLGLIRRLKPDALWSTYPIATAHAIGATLNRLTGVPWIADFRDPMAQDGYPEDPTTWQAFARIERDTIPNARRSVFTTRGAARLYGERFPDFADRLTVIENGFDEESYASVRPDPTPLVPGRVTLLHSGIIYPVERDPSALFEALARLSANGVVSPETFRIRFRASSHDAHIQRLADHYAVGGLIEYAPPIPYRDALAEMMRADGLLVMQANNCNEQIPAKVYEYIRAGQPILGLTDPAGDTADLLERAGVKHVAALENVEAMTDTLARFLQDLAAGRIPKQDAVSAGQFSRLARTRALADLLDQL